MTTLRRRIPVSGHGTRIPVRVEDARSGALVANTLAGQDGRYRVEVPGGRYRVAEKWGRSFDVVVPEGGGPFDVSSLAGEDPTTGVMAGEAPSDPPEVARLVEEASATAAVSGDAGSQRPARVPRDGARDDDATSEDAPGDIGPHTPPSAQRPGRAPRDGARERTEGPWTRVRRGERSPRDGGRQPATRG